jgi:hypothetical protein
MNKSASTPNLVDEKVQEFRKSKSEGDLSENKFIFEEFFEGDGPLGIRFRINVSGQTEVVKIDKGTVADETYGLSNNMILIKIAGKNISQISYEKQMKKIKTIWKNCSCIHLTFKKKVNQTIYSILSNLNLLDYYEDFIELGAKDQSDFEFIEENDLIKFGMNSDEISIFNDYLLDEI